MSNTVSWPELQSETGYGERILMPLTLCLRAWPMTHRKWCVLALVGDGVRKAWSWASRGGGNPTPHRQQLEKGVWGGLHGATTSPRSAAYMAE